MPRSGILSLLLLSACTGGSRPSADDPVIIEYVDSDGDTIVDLHEGYIDEATAEDGETSADTDGDGTPDYLDDDSDGDGVLDATEAGDADPLTLPWDTDGDGEKDFRDLDADGNCILDADEPRTDLDEDGLKPFSDLDDDGDGIDDIYEIGADCATPDSDGDGTADYLDEDSDGDGVGDIYESGTSAFEDAPRDADSDGVPDYLDDDSDGDGFSDAVEGGSGDTPRDTDGDGSYDFADSDSDGDGISDSDEAAAGYDPYDSDSDGDGFTDGAEVAAGTNPMDETSVISGLYVTVPERQSIEETFDFELSVQMGDVAFLLDTTGSMSSTLNGISSEFSRIVAELSATLPDAEYGVATFDDYAFSSYGSAGTDKPFELVQQVTSNTSVVSSTLASLPLHYGGDTPESSMEALYQGLTGVGYDQNCDGRYTSNTDVFPFSSSGSDPFGGSSGQFNDGSGTGTLGGFGFRDYALPIIVYTTDAVLRDPDSTDRSLNGSPGGCPGDAGQSAVVTAANNLGAMLIGISVGSNAAVSQMNTLAQRTNSVADTDGDGVADDNLVFTWSGSSSTLRTTIVNAITNAVSSVQFDNVSLIVAGDEHGFVSDIEPASYAMSGSPDGESVSFTLNFRGAVAAQAEDQIFLVTLNVVGDGSVLLDTLDIYVVVPGSGS
ncbi:MAG: hypothetical protein Q8P18_03215 [Pseudomonadota bacterium]|nr:hypothetical protein [Pseudomonadota bacterium]